LVFSPAADNAALLTPDGRVHVYDTGTGRLKVTLGQEASNGQTGDAVGPLMERHTCAAWACAPRKKKKSASWSTVLAVGTAAGDVKAFDAQLGQLKWRAKGCIEGGVFALAHCPQHPGLLYASGASGQLVSLSMETGEVQDSFQASKHALTCLALSPDARHAYGGGATLGLWQLDGQQRVAKYTGHEGPAHVAVFAPGGAIAASASASDRHIALWSTAAAAEDQPHANGASPASVGGSAKKLKSKGVKGLQPALASVSMDQAVRSLDTCAVSEPASNGVAHGHNISFHLAAVSEAGEAYVWLCSPSDGKQAEAGNSQHGSVTCSQLVRITVTKGPAGSAEDSIMAVKMQQGSTGPVLLVARGSSARPTFEQVPISAGGNASTVIQLAAAESGALLPGGQSKTGGAQASTSSKAAAHSKADVSVVGAGDVDGQPLLRTGAVAGLAARSSADAQGAADEDMADAVDEVDEEEAGEEGVPLGVRVAALEAMVNGPARTSAVTQEEQAAPRGSDKADSLSVLLTQALRSNDRVLLERCLSTTNPRVIVNTVARLVPLDAAAFLRTAVDRLLSVPARASQLAPWIKAVLHHHTGYIMSAPGAQAPLSALYQAIDARVSAYHQLLRLHGRLSLVTAHSRAAARVAEASGAAAAGEAGQLEPETVFQDGSDDEDVEVEDPFALSEESDEEEGDGQEESDDEGLGSDLDGLDEDLDSEGEDDD